MPELPEVETIKKGLNNTIINQDISNIEIKDYHKNIRGDLINQVGSKIIEVKRRAKYLIFNLSNKNSLIVHLKMTGQFIPISNYEVYGPDKSTRVIFNFDKDAKLLFNDWRKFGEIIVIKTKNVGSFFLQKNLGPEPLDEDFTFQIFSKILSKKRRSRIKPTLMNQRVIAGLGNIYAQEACFLSHILPDRKIESLTLEESRLLYDSIKLILVDAIKFNGTSFDTTYVTAKGVPGEFAQFLNVYGLKRCKTCKNYLKNIKLNSRSSYYCPKCQK